MLLTFISLFFSFCFCCTKICSSKMLLWLKWENGKWQFSIIGRIMIMVMTMMMFGVHKQFNIQFHQEFLPRLIAYYYSYCSCFSFFFVFFNFIMHTIWPYLLLEQHKMTGCTAKKEWKTEQWNAWKIPLTNLIVSIGYFGWMQWCQWIFIRHCIESFNQYSNLINA